MAWSLRSEAGYPLGGCDCSDPPVSRLRLTLTPTVDEPGLMPQAYEFACSRQRAATAFEVPPGRYDMRLWALDAQGELAPKVVTPPPQVRTVVWGQPASLEVQHVVAPCASRCANKNGMCTAQ